MRLEQGRCPRSGTLLERTVAYLVDSLLTGAAWFVLALALVGFDVDGLTQPGPRAVLAGFLFLLVPFVYFLFAEWITGTTVGKRLVGLHVRTRDNEHPGLFAVTVRTTLRLAWSAGPLGPLFLLLDAASIHQTEVNQRIGDIAGQTLVVREGPALLTV